MSMDNMTYFQFRMLISNCYDNKQCYEAKSNEPPYCLYHRQEC